MATFLLMRILICHYVLFLSLFFSCSIFACWFLFDWLFISERKVFQHMQLTKGLYWGENPAQPCSSPTGILMTQRLCGWVPSASTSKRNWWLQVCSHFRIHLFHLASETECFLHIWHVWIIPLPTVPLPTSLSR